MTLSYSLRLWCLSFASFFVLQALFAGLVRACSQYAIRFAEKKAPQVAANFVLALRLLPAAVAALLVASLCIPSYLWLEAPATDEHVSFLCLAFALFGGLVSLLSISRAARALIALLRHNRLCAAAVPEVSAPADPSPIVVIEDDAPLMALSGLLRPRLLISRGVLHQLSAEELDAALAHEQAHRLAFDNTKRLLLLLTPDVFPLVSGLQALETAWLRFSEWAADDHAVRGNSLRAVSLAAALVRIARMGAAPGVPKLSTSLVNGDSELSTRVERLLQNSQVVAIRPPSSRRSWRMRGLVFLACVAALAAAPVALPFVHELLEHLAH
jgi:Zn-dependent protease with chaperone function